MRVTLLASAPIFMTASVLAAPEIANLRDFGAYGRYGNGRFGRGIYEGSYGKHDPPRRLPACEGMGFIPEEPAPPCDPTRKAPPSNYVRKPDPVPTDDEEPHMYCECRD